MVNYDALRDIFAEGSDKRKIIDYLINEMARNDQEDIQFGERKTMEEDNR